ncbi:hypothetical protein Rhopal_000615-T1 [Rhodotorula paludigena]|uniref:Rab-GAP TBC domain-containing protein n=1 Tax=Rhodotorula paludigena TaxID=86838 RepID=A0AAV5GDE0_9BASI|nr:hypothetical protein Rhopal_000615-T1 [Rhodotorula paludigena]
MAQRHSERVQRFESLLQPFSPPSSDPTSSSSSSALPVGEQPRGLGHGIPDAPAHLRAEAYHVLLSLAPTPTLVKQYRAFLAEVLPRVSALPVPEASSASLDKHDKLLREIEQDVERTFGALAWFGAPVEEDDEGEADPLWTRLEALRSADRAAAKRLSGVSVDEAPADASDSQPARPRARTRRQLLLRPLFLYAFLNPGVSFVQGMSYLAAVLLYILSAAKAPSLESEARTFFAFGALLAQLRDLYVPTLDEPAAGSNGGPGLGATVARFEALLLFLDPGVADALDRKGVQLGGFVVRWLTTLFATEFPLPDVVRIWDRLLSLYPPEEAHQAVDAMSPVLSHLLDLALAIVEMERQTILSPYAKLPKILERLQDLPIEGEGVDRLLRTAWDIRERRAGRASSNGTANKRSSTSSTPGKSVSELFGRRLWGSPSTPTKTAVAASDFELNDDRSSVAGGSDYTRPRFGSLAFSSPRSSQADLAENVTVVEGKVLPPPPARVDQHETIASLIEQELAIEERERQLDYPVDDAEGDAAPESKLKDRLRSSFSRFASSDTAAALSKRATNLQLAAAQSASRFQSSDAAAALFKAQSNAAAKAQQLRDQLAEQGPERIAKLREAAAGASGRLTASTGSERYAERQAGSPREAPFTPPGMLPAPSSPHGSPRFGSVDMSRAGSNGPKPLLLSSAARRARSESEDSSVVFARSPSQSPVLSRGGGLLSPDLSIPPLSRSPSRSGGTHGRSASSQVDSPTRSAVAGLPARAPASLQNDDSPIVSRRVQDAGGRGWQLSDAPIRRATPSNELPPLEVSVGGLGLEDSFPASSAPASALSPASVLSPPSAMGLSPREEPFAPETPFSPPSEPPFSPPSEAALSPSEAPFSPSPAASDVTAQRPPRGSSLSSSQPASASLVPPRKSSLAASVPPSASIPDSDTSPLPEPVEPAPHPDDVPLSSPVLSRASSPSLSRSTASGGAGLARRPAAGRKRTSRQGSVASASAGASVDLSGAEARKVASEFLTRRTSASAKGQRMSQADLSFDESGFLDAYGEEEEAAAADGQR